jgi:hypothetical protein
MDKNMSHEHHNNENKLDIHIECKNQCRSSILLQYMERYPESVSKVDERGYMPLHCLLENQSSSIDLAWMMMEKYPAALQHPNKMGQLPLQIEVIHQCRSAIISRCIELYPQALAQADSIGYMPLHKICWKRSSAMDDVLRMMDEYPAALEHYDYFENLPIHIECSNQCRAPIILQCIDLYPECLSKLDKWANLPLHIVLANKSSTIEDALMMIEKYPAAVRHLNTYGHFPLHIECMNQRRSYIISRCIEIYPESLDDKAISYVLGDVNTSSFNKYRSVLSIIFTSRPSSLYDRHINVYNDIKDDPYYRRQILNLLARCVFTPTHHTDYCHLNWQPRSAMMMLLSQMKIN